MNALDLKEEIRRTPVVLPSLGGELVQGSDVPVLDTSSTLVLVSNQRIRPESFAGLTTTYTDTPVILPSVEPLYAWDKHIGWAPVDFKNENYQFPENSVIPNGVDVTPILRYSELTPAVRHATFVVPSDSSLLYRPASTLQTPNQTVNFDIDLTDVVGSLCDVNMLYSAASLDLVELELVFKLLATGKTYTATRISYDWDARLEIDVDGSRSEIFSRAAKITMERKGGYDTNNVEYPLYEDFPVVYKPAADNLLLHGSFHVAGDAFFRQKASIEVHLVAVNFL